MMKIYRLKEVLEKTENQDFIAKHLQEDIAKLIFKYGSNPELKLLIEQIASRQAIRKKLPSYYAEASCIFPAKQNLEQSSSEAIAKLKSELVPPGKKLADLSAGFGVDFRFLMHNFSSGLHLEPNADLSAIAAYNVKNWLGDKELRFEQASLESYLSKSEESFDLIYLDPSRRDQNQKPLYRPEEYQPNILEVKSALLQRSPLVLVKMSPMISIPEYLELLPETKEVWVLSEKNDCKEVSFLLGAAPQKAPVLIRTFDISNEGVKSLDSSDAKSAPIPLGPINKYLYLPNVSILKAGIQDQSGWLHGLHKIERFSHLYSSENLVKDFPGRIFECLAIHKAYDKKLKGKALQVIVRNFPDTPEKIAQKLKLKLKGASHFLLATQSESGHTFIEAKLIVPSMMKNGG